MLSLLTKTLLYTAAVLWNSSPQLLKEQSNERGFEFLLKEQTIISWGFFFVRIVQS